MHMDNSGVGGAHLGRAGGSNSSLGAGSRSHQWSVCGEPGTYAGLANWFFKFRGDIIES